MGSGSVRGGRLHTGHAEEPRYRASHRVSARDVVGPPAGRVCRVLYPTRCTWKWLDAAQGALDLVQFSSAECITIGDFNEAAGAEVVGPWALASKLDNLFVNQ